MTIEELKKRHANGTLGELGITVRHDEDSGDPRKEFDNMGTMICFHDRYDLGDKHDFRIEDYDSWDAFIECLRKEHDAAVILPLYLYDHGGITMSTNTFPCKWDSGLVGVIYVSRETILHEYGGVRLSKKKIEKATNYLVGEVQTYDQYLRGDIWGYMVEIGEAEDSCWGFYGIDYDDYFWSEVLDAYERCVAEDEAKRLPDLVAIRILQAIMLAVQEGYSVMTSTNADDFVDAFLNRTELALGFKPNAAVSMTTDVRNGLTVMDFGDDRTLSLDAE